MFSKNTRQWYFKNFPSCIKNNFLFIFLVPFKTQVFAFIKIFKFGNKLAKDLSKNDYMFISKKKTFIIYLQNLYIYIKNDYSF